MRPSFPVTEQRSNGHLCWRTSILEQRRSKNFHQSNSNAFTGEPFLSQAELLHSLGTEQNCKDFPSLRKPYPKAELLHWGHFPLEEQSCYMPWELSTTGTTSLKRPSLLERLHCYIGKAFPWSRSVSCYTYSDFVAFFGFRNPFPPELQCLQMHWRENNGKIDKVSQNLP